jgi:hypothetical protein
MILATKQIIETSNHIEEIKGVGEQFAAIQKSLEKVFQSQDALVPEDGLRDLLPIYDLYLNIESGSNSVERFKILEELELGCLKTLKAKLRNR